MRPGRMRNGFCWSADRLGAWTVVGRAARPKPGGLRCLRKPSSARPVLARLMAHPSGCCAATACGLPIRPVLKHGPRSLTCVRVDGFLNLGCARKLTSGRPSQAAPLADPDLL
ncbi:hypothetical protein C2845_PMPSC055535 [Panicum miliaceum]|uniref:Uncharacterized protein n=1 Tax=Panicum miliaceum TaxID=4540 RepID=A0A3L6P9N1_PANMI|nr:hypothetical protein C2845_PMPSC055535 [Panicum miliaceum]